MAVRAIHGGRNNQEGGPLTPTTSVWGQQYMHLAVPALIDNPRSIGSQSIGYRNNVGGFFAVNANVEALPYAFGYGGDYPSDLQSEVAGADPWLRP